MSNNQEKKQTTEGDPGIVHILELAFGDFKRTD